MFALRLLDDILVAGQAAAKTYGMLTPGSSGIREVREGELRLAVFDKRRAWSPLRVPLPSEARFLQSVNSVLSRGAVWETPNSRQELTAFVREHLFGLGEFKESGRSVGWFKGRIAESPVWITIRPGQTGMLIGVRQLREWNSITNTHALR
jgi:hypothetical protein